MSGAPTKYKEEYAAQAYKLALLGATDKEMADFFNVCEDTIYEWKKVYPNFSESIKSGKIHADAKVAESLYKRALGYTYEEKTIECGVETKKVIKEVSPDTGACMAWLKNRQKDKWRDKHEIDQTIANKEGESFTVQYKDMSLEEKKAEFLKYAKTIENSTK